MPTFVTRLLAAAVLFVAASAAAADGRDQLGDWTLTADRGEGGAPYCYAVAERGPGDRLTFMRSDVGLAVILTRRDWRLGGDAVEVDVAVDHDWHERRRAALGPRTLMLTWPRPAAVREALARGGVLRVTGHATGLGVRWSLAGGGAALDAVERCWRSRWAAFEAGRARDADPFDADGAPDAASPETGVDRGELARQFEAWLDLAAATYRAAVTPVAAEPARFALATLLGDGAIRLLDGATDAAVLARGTAALRAECEGPAATADHGRHDLGGIIVQRTGLACRDGGSGWLEALILSWQEHPGGLLIVVPDPGGGGLGAEFTAALVADLAARGGPGFDLGRGERPS